MKRDDEATMLVRRPVEAGPPQNPAAAMPQVTPLSRELWPAIRARDAALGNTLLAMLPTSRDAQSAPLQALCALLEQLTGDAHTVDFHQLRAHSAPVPVPDFGEAMVTRFQLPPDADFGVLACDLSLVESWLRGMLQEDDAPPRRVGPLTPQDFGLVTYLLLRALDLLVRDHGLPPLVLSSGPLPIPEIVKHLQGGQALVEVSLIVSSPVTAGLVRLLMPAHLVQNLEVFCQGDYARALAGARLMHGPASALQVAPSVSLGRVGLSRLELLSLEPGDALLLSDHGLSHGEITGPGGARLWLSRALSGAYLGGATVSARPEGGWAITIKDITLRHARPAQERAMSEASERTEALGSETTVEVEVRLGQLPMSFRELATLAPGQVLSLDVPLHQPVELVSQGRVIGTAELVNVEGRLGVRVLSAHAR